MISVKGFSPELTAPLHTVRRPGMNRRQGNTCRSLTPSLFCNAQHMVPLRQNISLIGTLEPLQRAIDTIIRQHQLYLSSISIFIFTTTKASMLNKDEEIRIQHDTKLKMIQRCEVSAKNMERTSLYTVHNDVLPVKGNRERR